MSKGQLTGMAGVFFVAAEASLRGFTVAPTSRGAQTADLLVTDSAGTRTCAIQVKTNRSTFSFWLMSEKSKALKSETLFYILVNIKEGRSGRRIDYYVVPSEVVAKHIVITKPSATRKHTSFSIYRNKIEAYENRWDLFGITNQA